MERIIPPSAPTGMLAVSTSLTALKCRSCGAPVPLGEGDQARCPSCGTETPIPEEHLELRALRTRDAAQRREADALLKTLDRPAWLFTKIVARIFDQPMFAFWILYAAPAMLAGIFASLVFARRWARHLGLRSEDDVPSWEVYLFASAVVFALVFLPRLFGIHANRRAAGRARLLAGLQARAPSTPGGPASCRNCGAPLEIIRDALVARCLYCQADSVLRVRTPLRIATRHAVTEVGHALTDAVALDLRDRRELKHTLLSELKRYVLRALVFAVPICVWGWDCDRSQKTGGTPAWGLLALVFIAFYLIALLMASIGRKKEAPAPDRMSGNDVPEWVGVAGPVALWIILYAIARTFPW